MIRRFLDIEKLVQQGKSLLLFGPRGVGKTSLIREALTSHAHCIEYNLLRSEVFRKFVSKPETLRKEIEFEIKRHGKILVFLDEIQRVPSLLNEVHSLIEEHKNTLQCILSGSSARKLRREGANLLAGRARYLKLHPLTFEEIDPPLEQVLQYGQLPTICNEEDVSYLETYVDIYLREEIYQESLIRKQELFARFLDVAAQYSGELINFSKIGKLSSTSDNTVKEYFQILVDTLLVHRVDAWSYSSIKQLNQQPRFYFFDIGILNAARGEAASKVALSSGRGGKLFEHLVILELIRLNDYTNARYKFFHYRERERLEIDLILHRSLKEPPIAIEIKVDGQPSSSELGVLKNFNREYPRSRCYCLTAGDSTYEVDGIIVCPWKVGIREILGYRSVL